MKKIFSSALVAIATTALFAAPTFATRYDISGDYNTVSTPDAVGGMLAASMAVFGVIAFIGLAITVFAIVCNWKILAKAVVETGVFEGQEAIIKSKTRTNQTDLFSVDKKYKSVPSYPPSIVQEGQQ